MKRRGRAALAVAGLVVAGLTVPSAGVADPGCVLMGTVGTPEITVDESTAGLDALAPATIELPDQVYLRGTTESFDRRWSFATRGGQIYAKEAAAQGGWRQLDLPGCLSGRIAGVSADDDELMAIDRDGRFFTMDRALSAPKDWNWSGRYGTPLWTGPGNTLPPGALTWSWSVLSPGEDHVWRDTAGNDHPVGGAKVSHVFALTHDGTRIQYVDPWLPVDHSYEMSTPLGGRFRGIALSTSASTSLIVNQYGDFYTRLYDFDISGADKVFFRYSYDDQRGLPEAPDMLAERIDARYAAIQLPAPGWVRQPKIPGEITDRLSIHRTGPGSDATPGGLRAEITSFDLAVSPTPLRLTFPDGTARELLLHTVDGLRQTPQQPGITAQPRVFDGTVEVAPGLFDDPSLSDTARDILRDAVRDHRFIDTPVVVTDTAFRVETWNLTLIRT
ncbi:hypothetical protein [Nocardia sp. AG03]|uniref:hypothetical protein n=1 Tax=Nocardia sp. AG03 TaxID=3025312 RepID=UPI0024182BC1|nr:hypothetical protein [Nocardia sp. AG03]